jgi:hypothetical protein
MDVISKFISSKKRVPKERRIAFGFVLLALTLCSALVSFSLPDSERWLGFLCFIVSATLFGGFSWFFLMETKQSNASDNILKKSVWIEIFHYLVSFTVMMFSVWFGIAAYSDGYSKIGGGIMMLSILFLNFKEWKKRYLHLAVCFTLGIVFIELTEQ